LIGKAVDGAIGHQCLGRRSQVEANSSRDPNRPGPGVKVDVSVPDDRPEGIRERQWLIPDLVKITVVAEGRHRVAHGRVNGSMGSLGNGNGDLEGFEEQRGNPDGAARTRVHVLEFGVGTEAAARQIDGRDLLAEKSFCAVDLSGVEDHDRGRRADGPKGALGQRLAR
jgi:hypothetical protein